MNIKRLTGSTLVLATLAILSACSDASEPADETATGDADLRGSHHHYCLTHRCQWPDAGAGADAAADAGDVKRDAGDAIVDAAADAATTGGPIYPSVALPTTGANFYVSAANGNDANPGTAASPWKTIQHAANTVKAGTTGVTVHVAPGTYAEGIMLTTGGTANGRVVFVSDVRWGAKVDATGHYWGWQNTGDYVDVVGFELTGSDYVGIGMGGSHCRTIDTHVHHLAAPTCNTGNGGAGIDDYVYTSVDNDMIGNVVHHIGNPGCIQIQGLYHSMVGGRLLNNIVYKISGFGIHTWHNPKNVVIANNLSFQNGGGGLVVGAGDNPGTGVAEGFVVTNNIFYDNPGYGMVEMGVYGTNTYVDNLMFKNGRGNKSLGNPSTGDLFVEPAFVDYRADGTGDYRVTASSPCVDSGTTQGAPAFAIDGTPRPQGARIDRGPYER